MILYKTSRIEILPARDCGFFILIFFPHNTVWDFFLSITGDNMQLFLIKNPDDTQIVSYKLARIVFAETNGSSLQSVEAMASMIFNIHNKYEKSFEDIARDKNIFDALNENSQRYKNLDVE